MGRMRPAPLKRTVRSRKSCARFLSILSKIRTRRFGSPFDPSQRFNTCSQGRTISSMLTRKSIPKPKPSRQKSFRSMNPQP